MAQSIQYKFLHSFRPTIHIDSPNIKTATSILGCKGSFLSVLSTYISAQVPLVCIMDDVETAGYLYSDIEQLLGEEQVLFFPSQYRRAIKYGHKDDANIILRGIVLKSLTEKGIKNNGYYPIIITYPEALAESVAAPSILKENIIEIVINQELNTQYLIDKLLEWDYKRVEYVYEPGQFAIRGSIFDIFTYASEYPYRLDFFDNEIDSIRYFEVESQLSIKKVDKISLMSNVANEMQNRTSLLHLLPNNTILLSTDDLFWKEKITTIYHEAPTQNDGEGFNTLQEIQQHLVHPSDIQQQSSNLTSWILKQRTSSNNLIEYDIKEQALYSRQFNNFASDIKSYLDNNYHIWISSNSKEQYHRILEILEERGTDGKEIQQLPITLHEGFIDHKSKIVVITEHQLFERYHKYNLRSDKARSGKVTLTLKELNTFAIGDYVVHSEHGIGQFGGLIKMKYQEGKPQEVIKIIYKGGDTIYVNLHSLHKLSHYRNKDNAQSVTLSSLGSGAWQKLKERTKTKVKDIARDLIKLYDRRKKSEGFAYSPDTYMQHEMEASFIYEPTPDQNKACEDVKVDMEKPYPMDRLLTGDVGFGKTEVAVRAAFKAATDSKQVAILVPTTLLALQHYRNFTKRLKDFPVKVDYLSRGRNTKDTKNILKELESGKIDIIIGTHRLTSKDVKFKDLGLLIIDEEQKFGVAVKEKLRKLQVNVDTLTMSATPIPRTLQFSLMGARDLSNISTPPPNRYPVETILTRFNEDNIREAISFELSRNGQVFFVHNRVQNIESIAALIKQLIPDARICVGHGKMTAKELETITTDFANHEYDILVATTIIENGIDIPNVNTIIINDAHKYGLSELHQLRGRVGRGDRKAFCFLFTPSLSLISQESKRRLEAIENFSDLGSGIKIALQDLDIRGAGNALGAEQSGFIAGMGYETYQKVFEEAVRELKDTEFSELFDNESNIDKSYVIDTIFESDLDISFPSEYVPLDSERILLYRELDGLSTEKEIEVFRKNLIDRFGEIPETAEELIRVPILRILASKYGVEKLTLKNQILRLNLISNENHLFYHSSAFDKLIRYITNNYKKCSFDQRNGRHLIKIEHILSVKDAIDFFVSLSTQIQNKETI